MVEVSDATKVVNYPFRPVGFKSQQGKETTVSDIKEWVRKENPNTISCLPNFAIWTGIGTIASALLGFIGIKKDSSLYKWLGGILTLVGIASSGFGVYLARTISQIPEKEKKAKEEQEKKSEDASQKIFETSIIDSLKNVSEKNEEYRDSLRRKLISTNFKDTTKAKAILEKIKSENLDEKVRKEAEDCLNIIYEEEERAPNAIANIQNRDLDSSDRLDAVEELSRIDPLKAIETITYICADKNDDSKLRMTFINNLGRLVEQFNKDVSTSEKQRIREVLTTCINDKTDDLKVRSGALIVLLLRYEALELSVDELLRLSVERLKDREEHIEVRNSATKVLGKYGDNNILEDLKRMVEVEKQQLTTRGASNIKSTDIEFLGPLINAIADIEKKE